MSMLRPGPRGITPFAITLPYTFVNGTVADATQVNANFAAIVEVTIADQQPDDLDGETGDRSTTPCKDNKISNVDCWK